MYRKKKKKFEIKKIILIFILIFALIFGYIANIVNTDRDLTIFEKSIKDGITLLSKIISTPVDGIVNQVNKAKEKNKMYDEYTELKNKIDNYNFLENENIELKEQLNEMKTILELNNTLVDYEKITATVIGRNLNTWHESITIDKGEHSGITINMPVIVSNGLIGKVIKTTTFTSTVRLLTANNINDKISVKIKTNGEYAYGILSSYNEKSDNYIIEGIAQNIEVQPGELVITTGMGDMFPSGIVIGEIVGNNTDTFDLAKVFEVKSLVDFNKINYVTILKRGITE